MNGLNAILSTQFNPVTGLPLRLSVSAGEQEPFLLFAPFVPFCG
jgi:hypothetical protein